MDFNGLGFQWMDFNGLNGFMFHFILGQFYKSSYFSMDLNGLVMD